jgi:hypothetical protein
VGKKKKRAKRQKPKIIEGVYLFRVDWFESYLEDDDDQPEILVLHTPYVQEVDRQR